MDELLLDTDIITNVTVAYLRAVGVPQWHGDYGLYSLRHNYIKFIRLTQLSEGGFSAKRVMAMVHWLRLLFCVSIAGITVLHVVPGKTFRLHIT